MARRREARSRAPRPLLATAVLSARRQACARVDCASDGGGADARARSSDGGLVFCEAARAPRLALWGRGGVPAVVTFALSCKAAVKLGRVSKDTSDLQLAVGRCLID